MRLQPEPREDWAYAPKSGTPKNCGVSRVPVIAADDTVFGPQESAKSANNRDEMTSAPGKVKDRYVRAREFLRRDEYDSRLAKEREALNAVSSILTREQWLAAMDPFAMLALLHDVVPDQELRAFCCACCRRMWLTLNATEAVMLDALRIAEAFATGQASREELHAAHQNIAQHAEEAGDRFARVNMKLGDSTDEWDYMSAAYDYEFAEALADVTDDDIGYAASRCISHALEVVRTNPAFASKEYGRAARASEEKAQATMIRERWPYPAESADRQLKTRRYRKFRLALATQRYLTDEQWKNIKLFAARLEGMDHEELHQVCREQISALSVMLPPATVQHILLDDLVRIFGRPSPARGRMAVAWTVAPASDRFAKQPNRGTHGRSSGSCATWGFRALVLQSLFRSADSRSTRTNWYATGRTGLAHISLRFGRLVS
jgi:hypothetical protein